MTTPALSQRVLTTIALSDIKALPPEAQRLAEEKTPGLYGFNVAEGGQAEVRIPFAAPVDGRYAVWLHGAAGAGQGTYLAYRVDKGAAHTSRFGSRDYMKGQKHSERIQWDRLQHSRRDAGTVFDLKKGDHVLVLGNSVKRTCSLVLDKVLITNDLSHVPPGKRFIP